ncbi:hypothetical protein [Streptomyces sp. NPDC054797]
MVQLLLRVGECPSKKSLALQIAHNRDARGLQGVTFARDGRAGEGKLSSRLGLVSSLWGWRPSGAPH